MKTFSRITVFFSALAFLFACSAEVTDLEYIERAQEYMEEGNSRAASIELKNALLQNPGNAGARWLLGKLNLESGNYAAAEKELRKASESGMADEVIIPLQAQALQKQNKHDELEKLPMANLSPESQAIVLAAHGLGKLEQNQKTGATELIGRALQRDPESVYAILAGARLHASSGDFDLARDKLDTALRLDPDNAASWSLLGTLEEQQRQPELAVEAYTKAIKLTENNQGERFKRALNLIQLEKYDAAQKDIDKLIRQNPKGPSANYAQGLVHYHKKSYEDALDSFNAAMDVDRRHPLLLYYFSATHFLLGNAQQAELYARQFHNANPDNISGRKLLAKIELSTGNYASAEALILPVTTARQNDVDALNVLAIALFRQQKSDEAIDLLTKIASIQPDSPAAQTQLGKALWSQGEQESAMEHLQRALQLDPNYKQADIQLALNYLQQNEFDKALEAAEAFRVKNPENLAAYNLLGRIHLASGNETSAQEAFEKARSIAPGNPYACQNLAEIAIKQENFGIARDLLLEILEHDDNHLPTLMKMAALSAMANDEKSMHEYLERAIRSHPESATPRLVMARFHLAKGDPEQALLTLSGLNEIQKNTPAVLELTAVSQIALKEYTKAKRSLTRLLEARPGSARTHYLLATTYVGMNKDSQAQEELNKTIRLAPTHVNARLLLIRLHIKEGNRTDAEEELNALREIAPDHQQLLKMEAALARLGGDIDKAVQASEDAFDKAPTTSSMLVLAHQRWDAGLRKESIRLLQSWVDDHPDDARARLGLANARYSNGQVDLAIDEYTRVLENDSNNLVSLNNLAWYLQDSEPEKALEYAMRANELAPDSAPIMDTLAVVLMKNNQNIKARRTIEQALSIAKDNPTMRYHSAMIDAHSGNQSSAIMTLESLLKEDTRFPEREDARKLLDRLQGG